VRFILGEAGFDDVNISSFDEPIVIPTADIASVAEQMTTLGAVRESLKATDDHTRSRVVAAIEETLVEKVDDGELRLSRGVNIVTAR
jgi:hypothetical protein